MWDKRNEEEWAEEVRRQNRIIDTYRAKEKKLINLYGVMWLFLYCSLMILGAIYLWPKWGVPWFAALLSIIFLISHIAIMGFYLNDNKKFLWWLKDSKS